MKLLIAAVALTLAGNAHAQVQTYCHNMGNQTVCQSYNTGAPQVPGSSSETVNADGQTYRIQTYGQPVAPPPPPTNGVNWGLLTPPLVWHPPR